MCDKPYSSNDKWVAALMAGLLFLILASPYTFRLLDRVTSYIPLESASPMGCPTLTGLLLSAGLFLLILRLFMAKSGGNHCEKPYTSKDKWIIALMGGLLFLLLASPFLFSLTSSFGLPFAEGSCPTVIGLLVHTILFTLIVRLLMR